MSYSDILISFIDKQKPPLENNSILKLNTIQRNALIAIKGQQVYDTDLKLYCIYNGSEWIYKNYVFLTLNTELINNGTAGSVKISNLTVNNIPSAQDNITINSGDIRLKPGIYKIDASGCFVNRSNDRIERECSLIFRRGNTTIQNNNTSIDRLEAIGENETSASVNMSFIVESTTTEDIYTFRVASSSENTFNLIYFYATIERLR